ncbi:putative G2/mitotic-specific cyclin cdc13, partial [Rhizoctonia solani 123E]
MSSNLDNSMDIDPQTDGPQPGFHRSNEGVPFDAAGFNSAVLNAIKQYKSSSTAIPPPFDKDELSPDEPILLYLVIRTFMPESHMNLSNCKSHLLENRPLYSALRTAYTPQNFAGLLSHAGMPDCVKERAPKQQQGISPSTNGNLQDIQNSQALGFQSLFNAPYIGDTAKLLIETLNHEREMYFQNNAVDNPYNWSVSVVQSSGMGKSRTVEEAGKTVFTFPINVRQEAEADKKAYPPPDSKMRQFFEERVNSNDKTQQADYMILLREMFVRALALVEVYFPGLTGAKLALAWANYLAEGQKIMEPGQHRQEFYDEVVNEATAKISNRGELKPDINHLAELEISLRTSCKQLVDRIQPTPSDTNACFVYIDEAHLLTQVIKGGNKDHERNQFHNLGKVLSSLIDYPVFFIFLSTNSSLKDLAPPASYYRSEREIIGSQLIPPFTELPFDIYEDKVINEFGSMTLARACDVDVMVLFGRPLWYTIRQVHSGTDVFQYARNKLSANGKSDYRADSILAALGVRVGITFDGKEINPGEEQISTTEKQIAADGKQIIADQKETEVDEKKTAVEQQHSYLTQSKLVESHMRVAYSIPQYRGYMHTGAPSEPVLAEAAGRYLSSQLGGIMIQGPERLSQALETGLLARGERVELVARLLVTVAHDIALNDANNGPLRPPPNQPSYHRPIRV